MSRHVWVRRESERDGAHNDQTIFRTSPSGQHICSSPGSESAAPSFREVFREGYPAIRKLLNGRRELGLGLVTASADGLEASAWFPATEGGIDPIVIGRHSSAEVFLPSDPRLSLRHLAVILHRRRGCEAVRFRVLDLRTPAAFADEDGNRLEAIESEGPLMLRCASLALLLFPTGGGVASWPEDAEVAWETIPPRLYLEREDANPDRWLVPGGRARPYPSEPLVPGDQTTTLVTSFPGPVFPTRTVEDSGPPRGELLVSSEAGRVSIRLGAGAARRGVLLGRYDRCDTAGLPVLFSQALSRVHLLLVEVGGALHAVDTASKNGTWSGRRRIRWAQIAPGLRLSLAGQATVEWRFFH